MEKETLTAFPLIYWRFSPGLIPLDNIIGYCKPHTEWACSVDTTIGTDLPIEEWIPFIQHISPCLSKLPLTNARLDFKPPWMNLYKKGDYQEIHDHVRDNAALSYCYFYKMPPDSGRFMFFNDNYRDFSCFTLDKVIDLPKFGISDWLYVDAQEGDLLVFPSFMRHAVTQHLSDEVRITVSGNLRVHPDAIY